MYGEEDLWVRDSDLGVDSWVSTSEVSGPFARRLLPSRAGGWRELTGDRGTRTEVKDLAVGTCAGI